jgi:hypothetical protein
MYPAPSFDDTMSIASQLNAVSTRSKRKALALTRRQVADKVITKYNLASQQLPKTILDIEEVKLLLNHLLEDDGISAPVCF